MILWISEGRDVQDSRRVCLWCRQEEVQRSHLAWIISIMVRSLWNLITGGDTKTYFLLVFRILLDPITRPFYFTRPYVSRAWAVKKSYAWGTDQQDLLVPISGVWEVSIPQILDEEPLLHWTTSADRGVDWSPEFPRTYHKPPWSFISSWQLGFKCRWCSLLPTNVISCTTAHHRLLSFLWQAWPQESNKGKSVHLKVSFSSGRKGVRLGAQVQVNTWKWKQRWKEGKLDTANLLIPPFVQSTPRAADQEDVYKRVKGSSDNATKAYNVKKKDPQM